MNTLSASINIGVTEGYFHSNEGTEGTTGCFEELVKKASLDVFNKTNTYVSFVSYKSKTLYSNEWGCPIGGEDTYNLETVANPQFTPDLEQWKCNVISIVKILKAQLKQSTVTIQFSTTDVVYLTED